MLTFSQTNRYTQPKNNKLWLLLLFSCSFIQKVRERINFFATHFLFCFIFWGRLGFFTLAFTLCHFPSGLVGLLCFLCLNNFYNEMFECVNYNIFWWIWIWWWWEEKKEMGKKNLKECHFFGCIFKSFVELLSFQEIWRKG